VSTPPHSSLDDLPALSQAILSISDEVIATLHSPQDLSTARRELTAYGEVLSQLKKSVYQFLPEDTIEEQVEGLKLSDKSKGKKPKRNWFDGCFEQILKAFDNAKTVLSDSES
jgi:hypothetical protein